MIKNELKLLSRRMSVRAWIAYIVCFVAIGCVSSLFEIDFPGMTPEHPGGWVLETAFWVTSIASAFLTFIMSDVLFRSRESRLLSSFPVLPIRLLDFQNCRVLSGIIFLSILYGACWLPHIASSPVVVLLSILLFPVGLTVCMFVSEAILMYVGVHATRRAESAYRGTLSFSVAPAIALAVTLMTNLVLKLLAEAVLKPDFMNAALTAFGIVVAVGISACLYARYQFRRHYYAVYATFRDIDGIVVNASYDYLDGRVAGRISTATMEQGLCLGFVEQFRRSHGLSGILIVTFSLVVGLYLSQSPESMERLCLPLMGAVALLLFSKPWLAFLHPKLACGVFDAFPLDESVFRRMRLRACLRLIAVPTVILALSVSVPYGFEHGALDALKMFILSACASFFVGFLMSYMAQTRVGYGRMMSINYASAAVLLALVVLL